MGDSTTPTSTEITGAVVDAADRKASETRGVKLFNCPDHS